MGRSVKTVVLCFLVIFGCNLLPDGIASGKIAFAPSARAAEDVTLTNIEFGHKNLSIFHAPTVVFKQSNLDQATLQAMFDGKSALEIADGLERLSAETVIFPELMEMETETLDNGQLKTTMRFYKDLTLQQIEKGLVRSVSASEIKIRTKTGRGEKGLPSVAEGTIGSAELTGLDLPHTIRVLVSTVPEKDAATKRLFEAYRLRNMQLTVEGMNISLEEFSITNLRMRPLKTLSFVTFGDPAFMADDTQSPEDERKALIALGELFDSIDFEALELTNVLVNQPAITPSGERTGSMIYNLAKITLSPGQWVLERGSVSFPDMAREDRQHRFALDRFTISNLSFRPTIEALKIATSHPDIDAALEKPEVLQKLLPTLGTWRLEGFSLEQPGVGNETARYDLKSAELTVREQINGIPTKVKFSINDLSISEEAMRSEPSGKIWLPLGVTRWDMSHNFEYSWEEAKEKFILNDLYVNVKQILDIKITGIIGDAPKSMFGFDETSFEDMFNMTLEKITINIEEYGVLDRFIADAAAKERTSPEIYRSDLAAQMNGLGKMMLGDSAAAKTLAQTIWRFIMKPGKVSLEIKPKNLGELTAVKLFLDDMGLDDILGLISVSVKGQ